MKVISTVSKEMFTSLTSREYGCKDEGFVVQLYSAAAHGDP